MQSGWRVNLDPPTGCSVDVLSLTPAQVAEKPTLDFWISRADTAYYTVYDMQSVLPSRFINHEKSFSVLYE